MPGAKLESPVSLQASNPAEPDGPPEAVRFQTGSSNSRTGLLHVDRPRTRMAKFFTLQEAEDCIPGLEDLLRTAIDSKKGAAQMERELQAIGERIHLLGGSEINPVKVAEKRAMQRVCMQRLKSSVETIEQTGCLVKDLEMGLLDFPAQLDGDEVYLCWKLGETRIQFWHRPEEGFTGRKRIGLQFGESRGPSRTH
ncbi:MAG: DUF2203 domain-containing protein [Bryobacterales bacterium]|nr:DUF2203 domain-containing protein [Bryobacterales bacterium]